MGLRGAPWHIFPTSPTGSCLAQATGILGCTGLSSYSFTPGLEDHRGFPRGVAAVALVATAPKTMPGHEVREPTPVVTDARARRDETHTSVGSQCLVGGAKGIRTGGPLLLFCPLEAARGQAVFGQNLPSDRSEDNSLGRL